MENEMRKQIDKVKSFGKFLNEDISNSEKFVYLLTSDGHRDSVNLQKCAMDDNGLKLILIEEASEIGQFIIEETINIKHTNGGGWVYYKYKDYDDDVDDGKYGFFKLKII
jgi:hypothetical protein